jgi:hypothetical protein
MYFTDKYEIKLYLKEGGNGDVSTSTACVEAAQGYGEPFVSRIWAERITLGRGDL